MNVEVHVTAAAGQVPASRKLMVYTQSDDGAKTVVAEGAGGAAIDVTATINENSKVVVDLVNA